MSADVPKLIDRFRTAGDARPDLNALVIYHPASRTAYLRELAACLNTPAREFERTVKDLLDFIPPRTGRFSEMFPPQNLGNHRAGIVHKVLDVNAPPKGRKGSSKLIRYQETWYIAVMGEMPHRNDKREYLKLSAMVEEAARLLPEDVEGDTSLAQWIIHLADREIPLHEQSRRLVLGFRELGASGLNGIFSSPVWVPFVAGTDSPDWWASWLPNVYQLSVRAIESLSPATAKEPFIRSDVNSLDEFREQRKPNGRFLTFEVCAEWFTLTRQDLTRAAQRDGAIRTKVPGVRGFVYRWDSLRDISDRKTGNMTD